MNDNQLDIKDNSNLRFSQVEISHKEIILKWFQEDHVKEFFYGDGVQNTLRNLDLFCQGINDNGSYTFHHWVAFYKDVPFAFIMTSPVAGLYDENDEYNKWHVDSSKTYTLDLLIGEKDFLGKDYLMSH